MSGLLNNPDAQTGLAGANNVEILLFRLGRDNRAGREEIFGINVLKLREVMRVPEITGAPESPSSAEGMVSLRGMSVPVFDLAKCVGIEADCKPETLIVTEYNGQLQGLLVRVLDNVVHLDRTAMRVPSAMLLAEMNGLVTAIAEMSDGRLVMMLDVERILAETGHYENEELVFKDVQLPEKGRTAFLPDFSSLARNQIARALDATQVEISHAVARLGGDLGGMPDQLDARNCLAGSAKMEILLFSLGGDEKFGINVLKVKEVCPSGKITRTPNMPAGVDGIVLMSGHVMPVFNLANFMGMFPQEKQHTMMVTESNNHFLGLLVQGVDHIVRVDSDKVHATEGILSDNVALITAITELEDGSLIWILDVERILVKAFGVAAGGNV